MPANGIETGRPHLEDISLAKEMIPKVRDSQGNVLIYDLVPSQPKPEVRGRGFLRSLRLTGASLLGR